MIHKDGTMKILCIVHADFETPGVIEHWAKNNNHLFKICKPYNGENCLNDDDFDFLIVMGGPQSPLEMEQSPYLRDEIQLIKNAISKNAIILGFCLGAQLIGEAFGAQTQKSPEKEVGVFPIMLTNAGKRDPLLEGLEEAFPVIHWHNDMPGVSQDSEILAFSEGCPRQIVRYTPRIYGFQCHLEIDDKGIQTMIDACPNDFAPSAYTQSAAQLMQQDYLAINRKMMTILDRMVALYKHEDKNSPVFVVSEWLAKEEHDNELYEQFKKLMSITREREQGCVKAHVTRQVKHPGSPGQSPYKIFLLQEFTNQQAFDLHCAADYVKEAFDKLVDGKDAIVQEWMCRLFGEK